MKMGKDSETNIQVLKDHVENFVEERKWKKFHNPKDLAISINVESGELLEIFQWKDISEIDINDVRFLSKLKEEMADIMVYCISLANICDIDLTEAVLKKLESNKKKYPSEKYFGRI